MALTSDEVREAIRGKSLDIGGWFSVLKSIASIAIVGNRSESRELLIRLMEIAPPAEVMQMRDSLLREHGLFPYLAGVSRDSSDQIAHAYHRKDNWFGEGPWSFHSEQMRVYDLLAAGENVVLSAPTSFGKSALIDAVILERDPTNAVIIVPTLALMDETRRRLGHRFGSRFRVITHGSMEVGERNLYVMTQERFLEVNPRVKPDLFVIDEFYKLGDLESEARAALLNSVLLRLLSSGAQFYMLGPGIESIDRFAELGLNARFISTDYSTVAVDVEVRPTPQSEMKQAFLRVIDEVQGPSIVYCRSPKRTKEVATWLIEKSPDYEHEASADAAKWVSSAYHPDWIVARALSRGIGIHTARLPRALAMQILRLFNSGDLQTLLATSTLIEGVNSIAKNVVVLDNTQGTKKFDYFTFANIRGRAGRMSKHFVGNVIVLAKPPEPMPSSLDIPVLTQSKKASESLLLQIPEQQLTPESRERLNDFYEQDLVTLRTLKRNRAVDPRLQLEVAGEMAQHPARWQRSFDWQGAYPTNSQVGEISKAMFDLVGRGTDSVRSAAQLAYRIGNLRHHDGRMDAIVKEQVAGGTEADKAIEGYLDFSRSWAQFNVPNTLAAAARIAGDVLPSSSQVANVGVFSGLVQNLFLPPHVASLEEYGLPIPFTLKLYDAGLLDTNGTFDDALRALARLVPDALPIDDFEAEMLEDVLASLTTAPTAG